MQPKVPRLIPHEFTIRQAKRKYTARKASVSWWEWMYIHRWWFAFVVGFAAAVLILYVKYTERQARLAHLYGTHHHHHHTTHYQANPSGQKQELELETAPIIELSQLPELPELPDMRPFANQPHVHPMPTN